MIVPSAKYNISVATINSFSFSSVLHMKSIDATDFAEYQCVSKNTIGKSEETIELYEIVRETQTRTPSVVNTYAYHEDDTNKGGGGGRSDGNAISIESNNDSNEEDSSMKKSHGSRRKNRRPKQRDNVPSEQRPTKHGYENSGFFGGSTAPAGMAPTKLLTLATVGFIYTCSVTRVH